MTVPSQRHSAKRPAAVSGPITIQTWAPTRAECLACAIRSLACTFADASPAATRSNITAHFAPEPDEDLLIDLFEETLDLIERRHRIPVDVEISDDTDGGVTVRMTVAKAGPGQVRRAPAILPIDGVELHRFGGGWRCYLSIDA